MHRAHYHHALSPSSYADKLSGGCVQQKVCGRTRLEPQVAHLAARRHRKVLAQRHRHRAQLVVRRQQISIDNSGDQSQVFHRRHARAFAQRETCRQGQNTLLLCQNTMKLSRCCCVTTKRLRQTQRRILSVSYGSTKLLPPVGVQRIIDRSSLLHLPHRPA